MATRSKRDSSYASTQLTKLNYTGGAPLSQINGRTTRRKTRDFIEQEQGPEESTNASEKKGENEKLKNSNRKPEPATDDEPLSTSDDEGGTKPSTRESSVETPRKRNVWSAKNIAITIDQEDTKAVSEKKKKGQSPRKRRDSTTPKKADSRRRTSQRVKKTATESPITSSPLEETKFRFPDGDPCYFSRPSKKRKVYGSHNNHSSSSVGRESGKKKDFIIPASSLGDNDDSIVHSSQVTSNSAPEFKLPMAFPQDDLPSSSQPTSPSRRQSDFATFDYPIDNEVDETLDSLSDLSSSLSDDLETFKQAQMAARTAYCPVCNEIVEPKMLDDFLASKRTNARKQTQFCRSHRKYSAEKKWHERGYPIIDWDNLNHRIEKHYAPLEDVLTKRKPSFFRNLVESLDATKKGTFRLTLGGGELDSMSSGYYGPRGSRKM